MAKAGFWLRGAKGKLAGAVSQKGEKGTILRENVVPSNPRTKAQMQHRIVFSTVVSAAKHLYPIINQSFEGLPNFKENKRHFIKTNIQKINGDFVSWEEYGNYAPKGISTLILNSYTISDGSLSYDLFVDNDDNRGWIQINHNGLLGNQNGCNYLTSEIMKELFDLEASDQITAILVFANGKYLYGDPNIFRGAVPDVYTIAKRMTVNDELQQASISLEAPQPHPENWIDFIYNSLNQDKTDMSFARLMLKVNDTFTDTTVSTLTPAYIDWLELQNAFKKNENDNLVAVAFFKTRFENGEWKYSPSELYPLTSGDGEESYLPVITGMPMQEAIKSYYQKYSSSDWFTRQGGDINSI